MAVALIEAIKKSRYDLGKNFEKLGKNEGVLRGRNYIAYDDKAGWSVRRLNCIQIFARWLLGNSAKFAALPKHTSRDSCLQAA